MAVTLRSGANSTGSTITVPGGVVAGDLLVLYDKAENTSNEPSTVVPSGFSAAVNTSGSGFDRAIISYKIATGTEGGTSLTGLNGTFATNKVLLVFDTGGANSATSASPAGTITDSNPSALNITAASGTPPLIVFGSYGVYAPANVSPRSFTPTKDGERNSAGATSGTSGRAWLAYKIYESSPANVTIDMDDEGDGNLVQGCYIMLGFPPPGAPKQGMQQYRQRRV